MEKLKLRCKLKAQSAFICVLLLFIAVYTFYTETVYTLTGDQTTKCVRTHLGAEMTKPSLAKEVHNISIDNKSVGRRGVEQEYR